MEIIRKIILIGTLPLLLILLATDITIFDQSWYEEKFAEENIYATINAPQETVQEQAQNILNYIQIEAPLQPTLLNEKEQVHMQDVQNLVTKGHQLLIILVMMQGTLWVTLKEKKKTMLQGSILTLIVLGVTLIVPFEQFFIMFHKILFTNDFWLLNPATDNLVKIYPAEIFQTLARNIGLTTMILALIGVAIGLYKQKSRKILWQKS